MCVASDVITNEGGAVTEQHPTIVGGLMPDDSWDAQVFTDTTTIR